MNPVCPGFMAHHVKPNRCRRCFRDMHDHDNDITTSFTISLPRRRRESVAAEPTTRVEETSSISSRYDFSSLGRRTRQRSSSTSSWFTEKPEVKQEQIDALFQNADDSKLKDKLSSDNDDSTRSQRTLYRTSNNTDDTTSNVRAKDSTETSKPTDWPSWRTQYRGSSTAPSSLQASATANSSSTNVSQPVLNSSDNTKQESSTPPEPSKSSLSKPADSKTVEKKFESQDGSKSTSSSSIDKKPVTSRFLGSRWSDKSSVEPKVTKPEPKATDAKPRESKIWAAASKFESAKPSDTVSVGRKFSLTKTLNTKNQEETDKKAEDTKTSDRTADVKKDLKKETLDIKQKDAKLEKPKEDIKTTEKKDVKVEVTPVVPKPKPWQRDLKPKDPEPKVKEELKKPEKSVLSRFPSFRKEEPKPVVVVKSKTPPPPSSSSSSEEESESESEESDTGAPVSANQKKPITSVPSAQIIEQKTTTTTNKGSSPADVAFVVKLKPSPSPNRTTVQEEKIEEQQTKIQQQEAKVNELQKSLETYKKDLKKSEDQCSKLGQEKTDLEKKKQLSDKEKKKLEKNIDELTKMKSKVTDLQTSEEKVKGENKKLKQDLDKFKLNIDQSKQELDKSKHELDKSKQELIKSKQELDKSKQELDKSKQGLEKSKLEFEKELSRSKLETDRSKLDTDKSKTEFNKYKQEVDKLNQELSKLKKELENKQEKKATAIQSTAVQDPNKSKQVMDQMKQKLQQSETLCQELMEENEDIKKEVRDLEQELEELHDNFREDQASEFRGLKKELETATKNCRVLQFKLRKAEKRCEQLELDRHSLEDKVRENQITSKVDLDKGKNKQMENELKMSKNLTIALNSEINTLKEALQRSEIENETLRQKSPGSTLPSSRSITPTSQSRLSPVPSRDGMATPLGKDYDSVARELYDTMERENDLREQLKFSEEEARTGRRKMSALEQENETLMMQMKKLNVLLRARKDSTSKEKQRSQQGEKDEDDEEEMSADNLKLQLEMQEQEMGVLRRKLEDTERENENFHSEVKYLQEKLINQPLIQLSYLPEEMSEPGSPTTGTVYWEKKARLLEHELRETRKKTIEKEREIERLNAEVEIYRKKASKMMVRSRSLDSDLQVDLKRQLQLVEQEASILRQKVSGLETENDKLTTDNKRLTLRVSKKPPMTSHELLHLDNLELKQKNEDLQRKFDALQQEFIEKTGKNDNPVAVIQDYKPRRESLSSMTDNENDLIQAMKKKLKSQDEEHQALQSKCMHLEIENNRLSRDHRRLKEALATKKKPMKAIRDSATRIELREVVNELQDEISELQVSLRGREVVQEGLEEELERLKKDLREAVKDTKLKEDKLKDELNKGQREKENIQKEAETQKKRASLAEEQFKQVSGQLGADQVELLKKVRKLQEDLQESERKSKAAEESLEKKTRRLRETQEKLNALAALKEDLVRTNRLVESQKEDLAKELEDRKDLLSKAESRITDLRVQVENTDRDVTALRKECNQLRNELEDERTRLKQADKKNIVNTDHSMFMKEREDLRRANTDLRNRIEILQQQINHNEQIWIEKESRLRDDHKRKKEFAVRDAREKCESALELAKEEEKILRNKIQEISEKLEKAEASLKEAQEKSRQSAAHQRRDKEDWQKEKEDLESKLRTESKKRERLERDLEQTSRQKSEELIQAKDRLVQVEREQRRMQMQLADAEEAKQKNDFFEKEIDRSRKEYDDLTSKYDLLEAELVRTKSKLVQDKELADTQVICLQRDVNNLKAEMMSAKDTYQVKQDSWIKEKLDLQELLKEYEERLERLKTTEQDQVRLKNAVEEKTTLIESYRKEEKHLKEERERLRRTVEEMSKASEVQRQTWMTSISSGSDAPTAKQVAAMKSEYEGRMTLMSSEIISMQNQIAGLASERDELRSRASTAERNSEEIKTGSLKRERSRHREEAEMARRKVKELRTQMEELKEQMDDALLENKNLKLQIETDRNGSDIQMAELKSKINQLEEQKILESTRGQTRSLAKTRLELAWEKERNELQHLLSETQRMVVDLKGRIDSVQGEMDAEKKSLRQQIEHSRESSDKQSHDSRRKMSELHGSLLDMRESQAKLRGLYDRMKRDRETLLSEREDWRQRLQMSQHICVKIQELQQDVEMVNADNIVNSNNLTLTTQLKDTLAKVKEKFGDLYKDAMAIKEDEKLRRTTSFRRAISAQDMNRSDLTQRLANPAQRSSMLAAPVNMMRPPPRQKALNRKSLSLDHTLVGGHSAADALKIWESEGEASVGSTPAGSLLSLRTGYESDSSFADSEFHKYGGSLQDYRTRRYLQTPSGMTTDSEAPSSREGSIATSCESVPITVHRSTQQKKATLKDKLKLLRRSKSIEVTNLIETKETKEKSLRSRISKVLKKPLGRSFSSEVHKSGPALPPKGVTPDIVPKRPTSDKPLSASRGELSTQRPLAVSDASKKLPSKTGRETPV